MLEKQIIISLKLEDALPEDIAVIEEELRDFINRQLNEYRMLLEEEGYSGRITVK